MDPVLNPQQAIANRLGHGDTLDAARTLTEHPDGVNAVPPKETQEGSTPRLRVCRGVAADFPDFSQGVEWRGG